MSTGQSISLFNEKKTSRFLSSKDDLDEDEILNNGSTLLNQSMVRGHQKKNSLQSLVIESLKFLNDDHDIQKGEKRGFEQIGFKTNPPSEFVHDTTEVRSILGDVVDDNYLWSISHTADGFAPFHQKDDKSYISQQELRSV